MKRLLPLVPTFVAILFPFVSVHACGPFFFDDVFVRSLRPDKPKLFAEGKLGILLPTYPRADLIVAYRYLNGGSLTPEEQKAYKPTLSLSEIENEGTTDDAEISRTSASDYAEPPAPADDWLNLRNRFAPPQQDIHDRTEFGTVYRAGAVLAHEYYICQPDAFRTAVITLQNRAKTWGAKSPELADWIKGQDAVFSNCSGDTARYYWGPKSDIHPFLPAQAPATAPLLLRQDRAYQLAAAQFYASQFGPAHAGFESIAKDQDSPWRGIAAYLVARCLVREAYLAAEPGNGPDDNSATFKSDLMSQAQKQLESIKHQQLPSISSHAIQQMLNLVRLRTEPEVRLREISDSLASPKADPEYLQDLGDLTWYLNGKLDSIPIRQDTNDYQFNVKRPQNDYTPLTSAQKQPGFEEAYRDVTNLRAVSPLIDWLITTQSPSDAAKKHAVAEWKRTRTLPWLIAALAKSVASDPESSTLIEAAAKVPAKSPAWPSATYHRIRLLIDVGWTEEARTELSAAFPSIQSLGSDSTVNLFTGLRMRSATALDAALTYAPRRILDRVSTEQSSIRECLAVMKDPKRKYDCKDPQSPVEFSADSAALFNTQLPLATLAQAAQSSTLPAPLRQSVAIMTWVRAVLLRNDALAAQMLPLLPPKLRQQAGSGAGFHQLVAILRNPGLRPYLDPGVQRSYSYDFVESYADNWWCADWSNHFAEGSAIAQPESLVFLSSASRKIADNELAGLRTLGSSDTFLGSQVLAYANAHPSDPDVPEALYLTLRMIRYGCYRAYGSSQNDTNAATPGRIAGQVVALMRHRYIADPWTKKAAPFVYLDDSK